MTSAAPLDIRPGKLLPGTKYTVVRKMGEGGQGIVVEVEKPPSIRGAAKLLASALSSDPGFVTRFFIEAKILAQIEHPHIVRIFDYDVLPDGRPFFVMELLKGKALDAVIREQGTLPPRMALRVMRQLLSALDCAHTHATPIVHRDVKPANVFLHKPTHGESVVKLLDFGISSALNAKTAMAGTYGYMAPEQLRADPVTARTDIYGAAVVLYEMLTGHGLFPKHERAGVEQIQYATLEEPAPRITQFAPWVPEPVADVIAAALEKDPARRPPSAVAFAAALEPLDLIDGASVGRSDAFTPNPKPVSFTNVVHGASNRPIAPGRGASLELADTNLAGRKLDTFASHESDTSRARRRGRTAWLAGSMLLASAIASTAIVLFARRPTAAPALRPEATAIPIPTPTTPSVPDIPPPVEVKTVDAPHPSTNATAKLVHPAPPVTPARVPSAKPSAAPPAASADAIRTL